MDILALIFFIASIASFIAIFIALIAPNSFVLRWAKLTERRRYFGTMFYFFLTLCFVALFVACAASSTGSFILSAMIGYIAYAAGRILRTGIIPERKRSSAKAQKQTQEVKRERPAPSPINVPFQQAQATTPKPKAPEKVLPSQILRADDEKIEVAREELPSRILERAGQTKAVTSEKTVSVKFGNKLFGGNVFNVPRDVASLLWFANGPLKNFDEKSVGSHHDIGGGFSVHIFMNSQIEPSVIDVEMPIREPKNRMFVEPLGYFPSYARLNEEQKWGYWNWLCNVDEVTDIGNVFIFYYGLERHLYFGKYKQAADMILRLRAHHTNGSFQAYSGQALLAAALYHKDLSLYNAAFADKPNYSELGLFVRFFLNLPIGADELMLLASDFGFTNKRYIKERTEMFLEILTRRMTDSFGAAFLPFSLVDIQHCPLTEVNIVANISLEPRTINVSNITQSPAYKKAGYELLSGTHEELKTTLKEMRKRGEV